MKVMSILKYVFPTVGIALLIGAVMTYQSTNRFLDAAVSAEGTVIDLLENRSNDSLSYNPVVQFSGRIAERSSLRLPWAPTHRPIQ